MITGVITRVISKWDKREADLKSRARLFTELYDNMPLSRYVYNRSLFVIFTQVETLQLNLVVRVRPTLVNAVTFETLPTENEVMVS